MSIILGNELGLKILEALKIDHKLVGKVTIRADAGEFATIEIERGISTEEGELLKKVFETYAFVKKEE